MSPCPVRSQHFWGAPVSNPSHEPVQCHVRVVSAKPYLSAAKLLNALNVEAAGYAPSTTRFRSGL